MISLSGIALMTFALPQGDLLEYQNTTLPGSGVFTSISRGGDGLFQVSGASIVELDLQAVRDSEVYGPQYTERYEGWEATEKAVYPLNASALRVVDYELEVGDSTYDLLYVAGGEHGLIEIDRTGANPVCTTLYRDTTDGRWCFDLELYAQNGVQILLTLWASLGNSELRVHRIVDVGQVQLLRTENLGKGTSYALEFDGTYAYVAMGTGGILRVNCVTGAQAHGPEIAAQVWNGGACQCLGILHETSDQCGLSNRVRDLSLAGDFLYAAVDQAGLIEIDLTQSWGPTMFYASMKPTGLAGTGENDLFYVVRVDAIEDSTAKGDKNVIAVLTTDVPSIRREALCYYRYGAYDWDLGNAFLDEGEYAKGLKKPSLNTGNALFVYDRPIPLPGSPTPPATLALASWIKASVKSVALQKDDTPNGTGRFWIYNNTFVAWNFRRDVNGNLAALLSSDLDTFSSVPVAYGDAALSLHDPNLALCSTDGGADPHLHTINPAVDPPTIDPIPGTGKYESIPIGWFTMGISVDSQWIEPVTGKEWIASSGRNLRRFRHDNLLSTWRRFKLPFPDDPLLHVSGSSYSPTAIDYRSDDGWLFETTSRIPRCLALFSRQHIVSEANLSGGSTSETVKLDSVVEKGVIDLHSETLGFAVYDLNNIITCQLKSFEWDDGLDGVAALAVAAGFNVNEATWNPDFSKPRVVFVNLGDCAGPNDPCKALFPVAPANADMVKVAHLPNEKGMAFAVDVAKVGDTQYAFVADTAGRVTALNLTDLFNTIDNLDVQAGEWRIPGSPFDGKHDILTDIKVEVLEGALVPTAHAYVAANRAGVVKLKIEEVGPALLNIVEVDRENTPGQACGLCIRDVDIGGGVFRKRLVVADHVDGGIKLYGEY